MDEVKPIVIAKYIIKYRGISKLMSIFGFLEKQDSDAKIKVHVFSIEWCFSNIELSDEVLMEELKQVILKNYESKNWGL